MITITAAAEYSINGGTEVAYQITYSDGTNVRAVLSSGGWIRKEYMAADGAWVLSGKPYIVAKNKKRQADRLVEEVKALLK